MASNQLNSQTKPNQTKDKIMKLILSHIVSETKRRSYFDNRVKVNCTVAEYRNESGESFRKSFECKHKPFVPDAGSHETLNNLKKQH